ncbi:uncharacterized protein LOC111623663 [Centruroides sculpturatus]|uniref:uncharacterized protein LOC111623663 n=1 Tax=Centruroides sculpturatus TaxID=218467 RepID=UPI000C6DD170|nr:uncharacterized protein LOC111623663 [Centruroides sculpturatus]
MDSLMRSVGFGVHSYHPFRRNTEKKHIFDLQYACKCVILRRTGLKRLKSHRLPLPNLLLRYLTTLSTDEFEELECAPFTDMFDLHFYHRALTYRVRCKLDCNEYLATYDSDFFPRKDNRSKWMEVVHKYVMSVYAIVVDEPTGNQFYLLDTPTANLESIRGVMLKSKIVLPEDHLWKLVHQLSTALIYLSSTGVDYGSFSLDNLYMVGQRLVLENGLTKKNKLKESDKWKVEDDQRSLVQNLGRVLNKLVYANRLINNVDYSDDLLKIIGDCQSGDPPELENIRLLSKMRSKTDITCPEIPLCNFVKSVRDARLRS